jgi:hypothetical protein
MTEMDDNWRLMAERQLVPDSSTLDQTSWQQLLADRYLKEVAPTHGALWERAMQLLVSYGKPLCYKETPLRQYPMGAPLSTGALVLESPLNRNGATVVKAVRVSAVNHNLRANHLPVSKIERGAKAGKGQRFDDAVRALGGYAGLTVVRVDTMILATEAAALKDNDRMRGTLLEADPPYGYANRMQFGAHFSTSENRRLFEKVRSSPTVAMYRRPLEVFHGRDFEDVHRPVPPTIAFPRNTSVEDGTQLIDKAIRNAREEQPDAEKLLDILSSAGGPVQKVLGRRAVCQSIFS